MVGIGALYNPNNVVVGQAALFVAPVNSPLSGINLWNPADPFDLGFWAPATWTPAGGTDQGWSTNFNKQTQNITIEEQSIPVAQTITSQELQFNGTLAEDSSAALALALNAIKTSNAATALVSLGTLGVATVTTANGTSSITLTAQNSAAIPPGSPITLTQGANTQTFISANTTTIPITSATVIPVITTTATQVFPITTTTVAIGAMPGYDSIQLQDTPQFFAVGLTTVNEKGMGRLYYVPVATQIAASATAFRRAAALRSHPVTFQSLCKPSQIIIDNFTAVHL